MTEIKSKLAEAQAKLTEARKDMPPRRVLTDIDEVSSGQIWSVVGGCGKFDEPKSWNFDSDEVPTFVVLVTAVYEDGLFTVYPVFRWGELAGPEHVCVNYNGTNMLVCLDMPTTLTKSALDKPEGYFSDEEMSYLFKAIRVGDSEERLGFHWGMDYFSESDHRLVYHNAINDRLETLQHDAISMIYGEE
jgi:hypothetical protein